MKNIFCWCVVYICVYKIYLFKWDNIIGVKLKMVSKLFVIYWILDLGGLLCVFIK